MILEFHLKTGVMLKNKVKDDHEVGPSSLTASTVHQIVTPDGFIVVVQGDNISHVINRGEIN